MGSLSHTHTCDSSNTSIDLGMFSLPCENMTLCQKQRASWAWAQLGLIAVILVPLESLPRSHLNGASAWSGLIFDSSHLRSAGHCRSYQERVWSSQPTYRQTFCCNVTVFCFFSFFSPNMLSVHILPNRKNKKALCADVAAGYNCSLNGAQCFHLNKKTNVAEEHWSNKPSSRSVPLTSRHINNQSALRCTEITSLISGKLLQSVKVKKKEPKQHWESKDPSHSW